MNERVTILRQQSLETVSSVSHERAKLVTEFYKTQGTGFSIPIQRALVFKYILENKEIDILPGELIVGERGPAPKEAPTFPELCCHSLEDLDALDTREKTPYSVSNETRELYQREIIPFWQGRSIRDRIFSLMTQEWKACYSAGIFTEFMEQRAPGHTVLDDKIYKRGFKDYKADIAQALNNLDFLNDPESYSKQQQLLAMDICADAIIAYAQRYRDLALEMAKNEANHQRKGELELIARVCDRVPAHTPRNFHEALQAYWFVHLGVVTELNTWDSFSPGRLDQHLYPFYQLGLDNGSLSTEGAKELLQCFWIKFNNQPAPPKVGVTAAESGTYTDFANISSGGVKADGSDGVNDLTYLVLDVIDEMRLLQPSTNIQLSRKNPDKFLLHALKIIRKGWGQPSIFNADAVIQELLNQGKSLEDARNGGTSGCVETGAFGKESFILTGYFNLPKILEVTLNNGIDPVSGERIGLSLDTEFHSMEAILTAFNKQLQHFIDIKIGGNNLIERLYAQEMPAPFMSLVIDDCIKEGKDYNAGGARYNTTYIQGVGIGTITDSLSALNKLVFEDKAYGLNQVLDALSADFTGEEVLRQRMLNKTPKYGNDDEKADRFMTQVFNMFHNTVDGRKNTKGGVYRINMLPTTCHVYFGSVTGASPDGRKAFQPLSEGISPVQGADIGGPTAVIKSAAKMDHLKTGGTLLNQKFTPQMLEGDERLEKLAKLVRAYFNLDGHHIQFNVVDSNLLKAAQANPQEYKNLIVRVAGYSDYFSDLSKELQDEIINRTEQAL